MFSGQSGVTISDCIFEYGQYGIYGNLTWTNGAPLYISNSTFRFNTEGINIYGKGLHLDNCNVVNNSSYGVFCNGMSLTSEFIDCAINDNNYGIYYQGSASADIDIENTYIQSNTVDGVKTDGALDLNMNCVFINDNQKGINVANGTIVKPYSSDLSGNYKTIYLDYGNLVLLDKYNQLQADNNYYALEGWVNVKVPQITATHNRWSSIASQAPVSGTHYLLSKYPKNPSVAVTVTDATRGYLTCLQFNPLMLQSELQTLEVLPLENSVEENPLPQVIIDGVELYADEAVDYLENMSYSLNSESEFEHLIDLYCDFILTCNNYNSPELQYCQLIANGKLHDIISDFYFFIDYNSENHSFNDAIEKVINMNVEVVKNPELNYSVNVEYRLDIALLERMREHYDTSIEHLELLSESLTVVEFSKELEYVQLWLCKIRAEKAASEGLITLDEFMLAIQDCEFCLSTKSDEIGNESDSNNSERTSISNEIEINTTFSVSPNPNNGSFNISINALCNDCEIKIINSIGQTVKRIMFTETGLQEIKVDGLKTGHYKVIYFIENKIIDSQSVVVE